MTGVAILKGMFRPNVGGERALLCKSVAAVGAHVRPLSGVESNVFDEVHFLTKSFAAF
eukprot:CAMPEP_0197527084 /NCGR_PEP_ID=MMETSP1318-20131121/20260_1 /TAXON_ID=552666 /ORGANISM="Partenskyella glossopodia, Strain RCC365" /LENGTH=57 /DNA_ID=CAMNT_0043081545 /DNA_START=412 /DNA_END=585 /DNA_ORIENTATION=+